MGFTNDYPFATSFPLNKPNYSIYQSHPGQCNEQDFICFDSEGNTQHYNQSLHLYVRSSVTCDLMLSPTILRSVLDTCSILSFYHTDCLFSRSQYLMLAIFTPRQ